MKIMIKLTGVPKELAEAILNDTLLKELGARIEVRKQGRPARAKAKRKK